MGSKVIAWIAALAVFFLWMRVVGSPAWIETVMGVVIAAVVWFFVRRSAEPWVARMSRRKK